MKKIIFLIFIAFFSACSSEDDGISDMQSGNDKTAYKYITIKNGDGTSNLYLAGMIGMAPGQISDTIKIYTETKNILYQWSGKDYSKILWDTLHIDLSKIDKYKGVNIILKK